MNCYPPLVYRKCAKVVDEECGGPWNILGLCDDGLVCIKQNPHDFNAHGVCLEHQPDTPTPTEKPADRGMCNLLLGLMKR